MTLAELIDGTLEEVGYAPTSAAPEVRLRVRRRINEWHRRLLTQPGHTRFLRDTYSVTLASVSGTAVYGLPETVARINGIVEATNDVALSRQSVAWLRQQDPGLTAIGTPEVYVPRGVSAVRTQPVAAGTLYVKSASASDTTATATLTSLSSTHIEAAATVTLTGTTAVAIGTLVREVVGFSVTPVRTGIVTLHETSGAGTELARLAVGQASAKYQQIQLWPTPTGAITYTVDATRDSMTLVQDTDEPLLPTDFHYLLQLGAVADEMRMRDDGRYEAVRLDMEAGKRDLKNWLWNTVDYQPGSASSAGRSRLGGWFPAGT